MTAINKYRRDATRPTLYLSLGYMRDGIWCSMAEKRRDKLWYVHWNERRSKRTNERTNGVTNAGTKKGKIGGDILFSSYVIDLPTPKLIWESFLEVTLSTSHAMCSTVLIAKKTDVIRVLLKQLSLFNQRSPPQSMPPSWHFSRNYFLFLYTGCL